VDPRISETIKWKSPPFVFEGNLPSIAANKEAV
jgi:hypothetical protein